MMEDIFDTPKSRGEKPCDWVWANDATGPNPYRIECRRCGKTHQPKVPISVTDYLKQMESFMALHQGCEKKVDYKIRRPVLRYHGG
jgi:hypothetical protein